MGYIGFAIIVAKIVVPAALIWLAIPKRYKNKFVELVNKF